MPTTVLNIRIDTGAIREAEAEGRCVVIDRTSKWGNPFRIGRDGTRGEVIAKYRAWILTQPQLLAALPTLKDKVLACWCRPHLPCHGDVLAEMVDEGF